MKNFSLVFTGLTMTVLVGLGSPARGFDYDEAIDGDLPSFVSDSPIFSLDIGENTFTGDFTFGNLFDEEDFGEDFDSFAFTVPDTTLLGEVVLTTTSLAGGGEFVETGFDLGENQEGDILTRADIPLPESEVSIFEEVLPLPAGEYFIDQTFFSGSIDINDFRTIGYTFSLTVDAEAIAVEPIPEPTAILGLVAAGSFGMTIRKRQG